MADKTALSFEETSFWLNEVKSCLERRDKELCQRNHYPYLIKYYEGEMYPDDNAYKNRHTKRLAFINEYFPAVNGMIAELMYKNPTIITTPTKPDAEEGTPIMNGALTYAMDRTDSLTENKLALFDMIMAGFSGVEVNYIQNNKKPKQDIPEQVGVIDKVKNMFNKPQNAEQVETNLESQLPDKEKAYAEYHNTYIRRWNPMNIILDYRAERIKDLRYVGKIIRMTHAEFSAKYPKFKDKVEASENVAYSQQEEDKDKKMVTLYELQVKKGDKYVNYLISPSYKFREIDYWERPYTTNGFNLKIGTLHEYGVLYPISVSSVNKSIQDDINNYATFWMEVAERNVPKRGYNMNKVTDPVAVSKLNSPLVNEAIPCDGGAESIWTIPNTNVSNENKELYALFQKQKEKLWSQSQSRMQGSADVRFAEEIKQQEAGFMARQSDIQEGLRRLYRQEIDTVKDIIATYWDDEVFFKVTGKGKPTWYTPQMGVDPITGEQMVLNPLSEMLSADYQIDVDIASSLKPNKDKIKRDLIEYLTWLFDPVRLEWLASQGKTVSLETINKTAKQFDLNPETLFIDLPPQEPVPPPPIEVGEESEESEQKQKDEIGNEINIKKTIKRKILQ